MTWHDAAGTDEVTPGNPKIVKIAGKEIGVFQEGGSYHAVLNFCPHAGAEICRGRVTGRVECDADGKLTYNADARTLRCPWHHWEFDLATGEAVVPMRSRLKIYPVRIEGNRIQVDI